MTTHGEFFSLLSVQRTRTYRKFVFAFALLGGGACAGGPSVQASPAPERARPLDERLAETSCNNPQAFEKLVAERDSLSLQLKPDTSPEKQRQLGYWQAAARLGCARVVTSDDGRVRIWTTELESMSEHALEQTIERGRAYLTWLDARDQVHAVRDADHQELHLDAIIDAVYRLSRDSEDYLVVGLRAYRTRFPGDKPRRFAYRMRFDTDSRTVTVLPSFPLEHGVEPVLLLKGPTPDSGKFRHHILARYWLRYHAENATLTFEPVPGSAAKRGAAAVAVWRDDRWEMQHSWAADLIVDHW